MSRVEERRGDLAYRCGLVAYEDVFRADFDAEKTQMDRENHASRSLSDDLYPSDTASQLKELLAKRLSQSAWCAYTSNWTDYHIVADRPKIAVCVIGLNPESRGSMATTSADLEDEEAERFVLHHLEKIYELDKADDTKRSAAKVVFAFVERSFARRDLRAVHRFMVRMNVEKMSELSLVGLVRATSRAKNVLPLWGRVFQKTRKALESRGLDHRRLLIGIKQVG